jgi:beta-lactamase class D
MMLSSCINSTKKEIKGSEDSILIFTDSTYTIIEEAFRKRGINGCFIMHDVENDTSIIYNQPRTVQQFLPASTYKIPNSLIALECRVIKDENEIIPWDSVGRFVPAWNKYHNLRTGIKYSVVWFYQELARRIGVVRMQNWVDRIKYGNMNIGDEIDSFWLVGELRITPMEQLHFLKKFSEGDLPFNKEHINTVQEILIEDRNDQYVFRAKTGWADKGQPIGWYIGYIVYDGKTFIFVNNIDIKSNEDAKARKAIVREVFKELFNIDLKV